MARDYDDPTKRPERVVILDADDPMTEIHAEFVWLDEHQRAVTEARESAYREGFAAGQQQLSSAPDIHVRLRRSRTLGQQLRLVALVLIALVVILMLPIVLT